MKYNQLIVLFCALIFLGACKKQPGTDAAKPEVTGLEIGSGNERKAYIGKDFHFEAQVTAAVRIAATGISIAQKSGVQYSAPWKMDLDWAEFRGVKNTTIHKHFSIPTTAPAGRYDFTFFVRDENGTETRMTEELSILNPADQEVQPEIMVVQGPASSQTFQKDEPIALNVNITGTQDDGQFYAVLISQASNHYPELISQVDAGKAIVVADALHTNLAKGSPFSVSASLAVGAAADNKKPSGTPVNGSRNWQSGNYTLVLLYTNSTHGIHAYKSIPIRIQL
ncbi:DUF4625 domain-containing protein [Pedobacter sp. SYP-B3415]|uniref:DUF4625 domain-containing protein n=1 Tax=Pedobacter sp. SYP-B3415 TaxID=2496641 RepID=UPI00101D16C2|nr:DUF4625 domain-containing protein [Pedobacter sp. SYP-B3415]